jgi:hypothetical protein
VDRLGANRASRRRCGGRRGDSRLDRLQASMIETV